MAEDAVLPDLSDQAQDAALTQDTGQEEADAEEGPAQEGGEHQGVDSPVTDPLIILHNPGSEAPDEAAATRLRHRPHHDLQGGAGQWGGGA